MDESRKYYHMVQFMPAKNLRGSDVFCIPKSWIKWEDEESKTVLVAYPDEPWEVTSERVQKYENCEKDWTVYLAKIVYSTDFYDSVIRCINQREHSAEEFVSSKVIATKVGSPHNSYSTEFQKWLDRLTTTADSDCLMENATEEDLKVQSDSTESMAVLDSDDDTPCDLSMRSSESRSISERGNCLEEVWFPEVVITEAGSSNCSLSPSTWQISELNESTFWSAFERWFLERSNTACPGSSMVSRNAEVAKLQHEASNINQASENGANGEVSRDWCVNSSEVDEQLEASSLLKDTLTKRGDNDTRWTLKHREWSPGLIELWPNTGVYIKELELNCCLKRSKKCTQLTRLLMKHIFTESALRKCQYVNYVQKCRRLRLDTAAITAILNYVLTYGYVHNWRSANDKSIKAAMRYELMLAKKKTATVSCFHC